MLFLKEHRKAKGISPERMAELLGIDRVSVHRLERELQRMDPAKQKAYADAIGVRPEDLWRPPDTPSLDSLVAGQPRDVQQMALDIISRLVKR